MLIDYKEPEVPEGQIGVYHKGAWIPLDHSILKATFRSKVSPAIFKDALIRHTNETKMEQSLLCNETFLEDDLQFAVDDVFHMLQTPPVYPPFETDFNVDDLFA